MMAARRGHEGSYFSGSVQQASSPASQHDTASSQRVKRKRNRVPVACFNCRALKTKCDGIKPVCSTCMSNGDDCQYSSKGISASNAIVMVNQQYLRSLEERLARLEQGATQGSVGDHTSPYSSDMSVLPSTPGSRPTSFSNPDFLDSNSPSRNYPTSVINPNLTNGSSIDSQLDVSADPDVFMGGVSFTQLILNAMNGRSIGLRTRSFCSERDEPFLPSAIFELPSETYLLVEQFFKINHTVSPIFHEPTIRISFDAAIKSPLPERHKHRLTLALLNMIFAVCLSHRLTDKNTNPAISRRYYDIAMELLKPTLLRAWHISKVQALVLGARYLQCSNSPDECWNALGLAIRIAHGLELHKAPPTNEGDCAEKEVRKRVWWACFSLDKLLSMIYGRPAATYSAEFTCPLPEDLDDECIFTDRLLYPSPKRASSMSFSIEVAKLYRILEAATRSGDFETSAVAGGASGEALAQSVLVLDERFQRWYADVPQELKLGDNENEAAEKPLILALRANMVRILIHRPSLALSLRALSGTMSDRRANEGVKSSILQHSRQICVNTAMETVNLIGRRHEQTRRKSGTSWFNLYYLFNAILILVSHVVDPAFHNDRACLSQLDKALAMIKAMSSNHTFAQKAYSFLQQLLSCMEQRLPMSSRRWGGGTGTGTPTTNQRGVPGGAGNMISGGVGLMGNLMDGRGGAIIADEELFAGLFDFTQDLSETYADIGNEMSAWFDGQEPVYSRGQL